MGTARFGDGPAVEARSRVGIGLIGFRGERDAGLSVTNTTYTNLTYNSEDFDPTSMCTGTTATIQTAGMWSLFAVFGSTTSSMGSTVVQRIVSSRYGNIDFNDYGATGDILFRLPGIWCEVGDTFALQFYQSSGATITVTTGHWQMERL